MGAGVNHPDDIAPKVQGPLRKSVAISFVEAAGIYNSGW